MDAQILTRSRRDAAIRVGRLTLIAGCALAITNLGLPQWLTGPLVNALLILTVTWCGVSQAILVGMVTPVGAALRGVLPLPLLAMAPFIALGNAALVGVYGSMRRRSPWLVVPLAAVVKFAMLASAVTLLTARPLSIAVGGVLAPLVIPQALAGMMTWPQLATALAGGVIAWGVRAAAARAAEGEPVGQDEGDR